MRGLARRLLQSSVKRVPQATTKQFGSVEYNEQEAIEFPLGLPAFEEERKFLLIERTETKPIAFLQSLSRPELCFVTLPLLVVDPTYRLAVSAEDLRVLGLTDVLNAGRQPVMGNEVQVYAIMSAANSRPTANLLAPVVVGISSGPKVGVQAIRMDRVYSHEHVWEPPPC